MLPFGNSGNERVNSRFKRSVTYVKTYPGADCGLDCDHVPVVASKVKERKEEEKKFRVRKVSKGFNGEQMRRKCLIDVKNRYEVLGEDVSETEEEEVEREWMNL